MRIISKFSDYYDSVLISDEPVFVRHSDVFKLSTLPFEFSSKIKDYFDRCPYVSFYYRDERKRYNSYRCERNLLFFCGKVIPLYYTKRYEIYSAKYEDFKSEILKENPELKISRTDLFWNLRFKKLPYEEALKVHIKEYGIDQISTDINLFFKSPIVLVSEEEITTNISLKKYKFQKLFDPWTCAQEIEMFLGNILLDIQDPRVIISDELKRHSKGMDEWSFKQIGPKQRKRKETN